MTECFPVKHVEQTPPFFHTLPSPYNTRTSSTIIIRALERLIDALNKPFASNENCKSSCVQEVPIHQCLDYIKVADLMNPNRYFAVNFLNLYYRRAGTVEYRMAPASGLNSPQLPPEPRFSSDAKIRSIPWAPVFTEVRPSQIFTFLPPVSPKQRWQECGWTQAVFAAR
jgi:hypothetical protein